MGHRSSLAWRGAILLSLATCLLLATAAIASAKTTTKLGLSASTQTPAYKASVTLKVKLTTASGKAVKGKKVTLQRRAGSTWVKVKTAKTSSKGKVSFSTSPVGGALTVYRAKFSATGSHKAAVSKSVTVTPKVSISKPAGPATWTVSSPFDVTGTLKPVPPGTGAVNVYRYWGDTQDGPWTQDAVVATTLAAGTGGSQYTASVVVPGGHTYWRFVARYEGDALHAATWSPAAIWWIDPNQ